MDKIKALLLPLALVFAAIAIFEFGARYGASNTRAAALTGQLNNFTNLYLQVEAYSDENSKANLGAVIDNHIMTASLVRGAWYLRIKQEPKKSLEKAISKALGIRGDGLLERLDALQSSTEENTPKLTENRYLEVRAALESALSDLTKEPEQTVAPGEAVQPEDSN